MNPPQPPHSGAPQYPAGAYQPPAGYELKKKKRKKWPFVLGAIVLLFVIIAMSSGGNSGSTSTATDPAASAPALSTDSGNSAAFGTPIDRDGLVLTVTRPKPGDSTIRPTVCTTVTYENNTDQPVNFNALDWKLTDTAGVQVNTGFLGGDASKTLSAGTLNPGGTKTGQVCFDRGAGDPAEVAYTGSLFGSPTTWQ
jgi:Domain of unknown function (DUF4352)